MLLSQGPGIRCEHVMTTIASRYDDISAMPKNQAPLVAEIWAATKQKYLEMRMYSCVCVCVCVCVCERVSLYVL